MVSVRMLFRFFILLCVLYLGVVLFKVEFFEFYLKPLLLLPLIVAVFISKIQNRSFLTLALVFSWTGDTILLFVFKDAIYFILGLIAFLIAHIFYILLFTKELRKPDQGALFRKPGLYLILIYLLVLLWILLPHLGSLTVPVIIYAIVISTMLYLAYLLYFHLRKPASGLLITGAISFILSDSILAFDKFYQPVPLSGFLIMVSYLYAQGALAKCFLSPRKNFPAR